VLPGGSVWTFALMPIESREDNPGRVVCSPLRSLRRRRTRQAGADSRAAPRRMHGTALRATAPRMTDPEGAPDLRKFPRVSARRFPHLGVEGKKLPSALGRAAQAR